MLSEDQRERIEEEEAIRQLVRFEWEEKRKRLAFRKGRIWSTLNNSFVLWSFSFVMLALLGFGLITYHSIRHERAERRQIQEKLRVETASRINEARNTLELLRIDLEYRREYHSPQFIYSVVVEVLNGNSSGIGTDSPSTVYPEFERRTLASLVYEWQRVARGPERQSFDNLLSTYQGLRTLAFSSDDDVPDKPTEEQYEASLEAVRKAGSEVNEIQATFLYTLSRSRK